MKTRVFIIMMLILGTLAVQGQAKRQVLNMPDIPGYVTLKCDFHIHTIFSDGYVWPTVRIGEAWRDGLDVIAITDHIEYQPHKQYIPISHNAAWDICREMAKEWNIILIHGAEFTRKMPPGHLNALFIQDAAPLDTSDFMIAIEEAIKQGAFIQYNHPGWKAQEKDGIPKLYPIHNELIAKKWLHGIEYFNDSEVYPLVLDMCRDNKVAIMGNSDLHILTTDKYQAPEYKQRPVTLVFARERTTESIREALFAGRTAVWHGDFLAGFEEYTAPLFKAAVTRGVPFKEDDKNIWFELQNHSDLPMELTEGVEGTPVKLTLPANSVIVVKASRSFVDKPLRYKVINIITGNGTVLEAEIGVPTQEAE